MKTRFPANYITWQSLELFSIGATWAKDKLAVQFQAWSSLFLPTGGGSSPLSIRGACRQITGGGEKGKGLVEVENTDGQRMNKLWFSYKSVNKNSCATVFCQFLWRVIHWLVGETSIFGLEFNDDGKPISERRRKWYRWSSGTRAGRPWTLRVSVATCWEQMASVTNTTSSDTSWTSSPSTRMKVRAALFSAVPRAENTTHHPNFHFVEDKTAVFVWHSLICSLVKN